MNDFVPTVPAALRWHGGADGHLEILDQTLLPGRTEHVHCRDVPTVVEAIKMLRVRGAPAIGIAGGYGLVLAVAEAKQQGLSPAPALTHIRKRAHELATARPTAVNLQWAVDRLLKLVDTASDVKTIDLLATSLLNEARCIHEEDRELCAAIGRFGAEILPEGDILTHCNTGSLATGGAGTALGVIVTAWRRGRRFRVFADETRPRSVAIGDRLLISLRGVNLNPESDPEDMVSVRMWLGPDLMVTTRHRRILAMTEAREHLAAGNGPRDTGGFLTFVAERLMRRMGPTLDQLADTVDALENAIVETDDSDKTPNKDSGELRRRLSQ
ncbi:MAG: hypothetical protein EBZ13_14210, partial [Planctomycetia bacterium]|nr:hypothetical protein [Planctomycetia bacterium]